MSNPLTQSQSTTGTTTLSFPPVRTASVKLATQAATPAFPTVINQVSSLFAGQPPILSHALARINANPTAVANATLPSILLPPPQSHLRRPNRLPINDAAASPKPTQITPLTMLTSLVGISHPVRQSLPARGRETRVSHSGLAQPVRRK